EYSIFKTLCKLLTNFLKNVINYPNDSITVTLCLGWPFWPFHISIPFFGWKKWFNNGLEWFENDLEK
ncbi:hypothetical protein OFM39_24400, partial [Escherichia coli]|nr:hypothetical protein [Escherichia coli]